MLTNRPSSQDIAQKAFCQALDRFKKEFGDKPEQLERLTEHTSIEDIHVALHQANTKLAKKSPDDNRTGHWLEKISSRIVYYGAVLDMLAQHHPEYVSLAWGATKFVLMVRPLFLPAL